MTIETKYNLGDEVWANIAGTPMLCKVADITMIEDEPYIKVAYTVCSTDERVFGTRYGNELYPTKEELLKSL
jgi:hypothetical protein